VICCIEYVAYWSCMYLHIIKLMINNKSASKSRKKPEKVIQPDVHDAFEDHNNEQTQSSKAFKKLSMSFYNWATKNT
jgi:hypothetical protein